MRYRHYTLIILALAVLFQGCERQFDIDISATGKLFLQCFPGQRDTTIIQLYKTNPLGGKVDFSSILDEADLSFKVDGVECKPQKARKKLGSVFSGCWFVPGDVPSGSKVEITARCGIVDPVGASTVIPAPVPEFSYILSDDAVSISLNDDNAANTYYGLAVICERTVDSGDTREVWTVNMDPLDDGGKIAGMPYNRTYMDIEFDGRTVGGKGKDNVRVWSDEVSKEGNVDLAMRIGLDDGKLPVYDMGDSVSLRYKVRVYRFSRELFLYAESLFLSSYDVNTYSNGIISAPVSGSWGKYGITPPVLSFTNVSNGLGVLAGWTMRETEWISLD